MLGNNNSNSSCLYNSGESVLVALDGTGESKYATICSGGYHCGSIDGICYTVQFLDKTYDIHVPEAHIHGIPDI